MKATAALSILALAATAAATPVEVVARTGGGGGTPPPTTPTCDSNQHQVCCASVLGIQCLIDILGGGCSGGTYCCDAGSATVSKTTSLALLAVLLTIVNS